MNRIAKSQRDHSLGCDSVALLSAGALDLLPLATGLIGEHGELLAANPAWQRLALRAESLDLAALLPEALCSSGHGASAQGTERLSWSAVRRRMRGRVDPAPPPVAWSLSIGERWFEVRVTRPSAQAAGCIVTCEDITERRQTQLNYSRARAALLAGPDALFVLDVRNMGVVEVNDAACRIFARERAELLALPPYTLFASTAAELRASCQALITSGAVESGDVQVCRPDGGSVSLELRRQAVEIGDEWFVIATARDVSAGRTTQAARQRQELQHQLLARFGQLALESPPFAEIVTEAVEVLRRGLDVELCRVLELAEDERSLIHVAGCGWSEAWLESTKFDAATETEDRFVFGARESLVVDDYAMQTRIVPSPIQKAHAVQSSVEALICGVKGTYGVVGAFAREPARFDQVSADFVQSVANTLAAFIERKLTEERLAYMAQFDALTGLPNRTLYLDRLGQTLIEASRDKLPVAVLFVDIDRFKAINDTLGHAVGDQLLVYIAERLSAAVRPADTVGRLSGDEFAVALAHLARAEDAGLVAKKIVASLAEPFRLEGQSVYVSASVGISTYPHDGMQADQLLKNADAAMYRAKEAGRNAYQFFAPKMHEGAMQRTRTQTTLCGAVDCSERSTVGPGDLHSPIIGRWRSRS